MEKEIEVVQSMLSVVLENQAIIYAKLISKTTEEAKTEMEKLRTPESDGNNDTPYIDIVTS